MVTNVTRLTSTKTEDITSVFFILAFQVPKKISVNFFQKPSLYFVIAVNYNKLALLWNL